jgi:hypothetical protein
MMSELEKALTITRAWMDAGIPVKNALYTAYVAMNALEEK